MPRDDERRGSILRADLPNRFMHHAPFGDQTIRYAGIRQRLLEVADRIVDVTPNCREQSIAVTKLEEAMFWANAAIARREHPFPENCKPERPAGVDLIRKPEGQQAHQC